jgi:hypothetical protein
VAVLLAVTGAVVVPVAVAGLKPWQCVAWHLLMRAAQLSHAAVAVAAAVNRCGIGCGCDGSG